jgi:hypothetical protein
LTGQSRHPLTAGLSDRSISTGFCRKAPNIPHWITSRASEPACQRDQPTNSRSMIGPAGRCRRAEHPPACHRHASRVMAERNCHQHHFTALSRQQPPTHRLATPRQPALRRHGNRTAKHDSSYRTTVAAHVSKHQAPQHQAPQHHSTTAPQHHSTTAPRPKYQKPKNPKTPKKQRNTAQSVRTLCRGL